MVSYKYSTKTPQLLENLAMLAGYTNFFSPLESHLMNSGDIFSYYYKFVNEHPTKPFPYYIPTYYTSQEESITPFEHWSAKYHDFFTLRKNTLFVDCWLSLEGVCVSKGVFPIYRRGFYLEDYSRETNFVLHLARIRALSPRPTISDTLLGFKGKRLQRRFIDSLIFLIGYSYGGLEYGLITLAAAQPLYAVYQSRQLGRLALIKLNAELGASAIRELRMECEKAYPELQKG
ncbi:MAG: hypothetical protein QXK37_05130 [Candidatus Woesearchaeota archaeon]